MGIVGSAPGQWLRLACAVSPEHACRRSPVVGNGCRRSPNLNAYAERFVRTIKESCLERMILVGEASLRTAILNFVAHYPTERNQEGLGNRLISPKAGHFGSAGMDERRQRLGGMLNYYYREGRVAF